MSSRRVGLLVLLTCLVVVAWHATTSTPTRPSIAPTVESRPSPVTLTRTTPLGGPTVSGGPVLAPLGPESIRTVHLDMVRKVVEIAPGTRYRARTFGGQVPGPTIHAREGDTIRFSMTNRYAPATPGRAGQSSGSITFHGASMSSADPRRSVAPGQTLSFEFKVGYPGVFMYHSASPMVLENVASGLFGCMVVEPRQGWPTQADREYVVVQSELYARFTGKSKDAFVLDPVTVRTGQVSHVLFNGGLFELARHPLLARPAERVRLYLLNAGPNKTSSFHVEGIVFDRIWVGGNPANPMRGLPSVTLPPGCGAIVEFTIPEAGRYLLLDHNLDMATEGAMGLIDASGAGSGEPPLPVDPHPLRPAASSQAELGGFLLFQRRCSVCHSARLGARVGWEGPNLAGVTKRHKREKITAWLKSPQALLDTDRRARALVAEFKYRMPAQDLSPEEIERLLAYLRWVDQKTQ